MASFALGAVLCSGQRDLLVGCYAVRAARRSALGVALLVPVKLWLASTTLWGSLLVKGEASRVRCGSDNGTVSVIVAKLSCGLEITLGCLAVRAATLIE